MNMALAEQKIYTMEDIYNLPDGQRAELIDGKLYNMAPPTRQHQQIILYLARKISDYIDEKKGSCEVDLAPFAVFLNEDNRNYVEPDISVTVSYTHLDVYKRQWLCLWVALQRNDGGDWHVCPGIL